MCKRCGTAAIIAMVFVIESESRLRELMAACEGPDLPAKSYDGVRLMSTPDPDELTHGRLEFGAFTDWSVDPGDPGVTPGFFLCRSKRRFYLHYYNVAGHGGQFGVLPLRVDDVLDLDLMRSLTERRSWRLSAMVDRSLDYPL